MPCARFEVPTSADNLCGDSTPTEFLFQAVIYWADVKTGKNVVVTKADPIVPTARCSNAGPVLGYKFSQRAEVDSLGRNKL